MEIRIVSAFLVAALGCGAQERALIPDKEMSATLSVSAPPTVKAGEWMTVDAFLTNLGDKTIVMEAGGKEIATDFLRADTDVQVYSLPGPVVTAELHIIRVAPGETFRVTRQWDMTNGAGIPVPPGTYKIRPRAVLPNEYRVRVDATPITFIVTK